MKSKLLYSFCLFSLCGCITGQFPENGYYRTHNEHSQHEAVVKSDVITLSYGNQPAYAELPYEKVWRDEIGPLFDMSDTGKRRAYYLYALSTNSLSVVRMPSPPFPATTNYFHRIYQQ